MKIIASELDQDQYGYNAQNKSPFNTSSTRSHHLIVRKTAFSLPGKCILILNRATLVYATGHTSNVQFLAARASLSSAESFVSWAFPTPLMGDHLPLRTLLRIRTKKTHATSSFLSMHTR